MAARTDVLAAAYVAHPERFVAGDLEEAHGGADLVERALGEVSARHLAEPPHGSLMRVSGLSRWVVLVGPLRAAEVNLPIPLRGVSDKIAVH